MNAPEPLQSTTRPPRRRLPWPSGRLGRVHYIARALGATILCTLLSSLLTSLAILLTSPAVGLPILNAANWLLFGLLLPCALLYWSIERAHDVGVTGWLSLLMLLPFIGQFIPAFKLAASVSLLFWIWPGNKGANRFGPPTKPASLGLRIVVGSVIALLLGFYFYSRINGPIVPDPPAKPTSGLPSYRDASTLK